jgi:hypothetical protein
VFLLGAVAYAVAPGHPLLPDAGVPIGFAAAVVLALSSFAVAFWWRTDVRDSAYRRAAYALWACAILKIAIGAAAPVEGWLGAYYANEDLQPPVRSSTEFDIPGATRIDRRIDFRDDRIPVYFLNEAGFNRGDRREVTEPYSIRWTGHVNRGAAGEVRLMLAARGAAQLTVDGDTAAVVDERRALKRVEATAPLGRGPHVLEVVYRKPANVDAAIEVTLIDRAGKPLPVTPAPAASMRVAAGRWLTYAATGLHLIAIALVLVAIAGMYRARPITWSLRTEGAERAAYVATFAIFFVQGVARSLPFIGRTWSLSGGDDWQAFEARAREIATGGILMRFGQPLGHGDPYAYYPLYSYFIALVHKVVGEDLSGVIFVQFLILVATDVVVHRTAKRLFGATVALWALGALVLLQQLDFVRYYTVTLLSENLYFLTVSVTVYLLVRFVQTGERSTAGWAGVAGGVSSLTRPAMMLFLLPSLALVAIAGRRRTGRAAPHVLAYSAAWMAIVSLATIRNYLVSGHPVLITVGQAWSLVIYNLPASPDAVSYMNAWTGGLISTANILLRIVSEHPLGYLRDVSTKILFSLGLTQLMGGRMHPELVLVSIGYVLALVFHPSARRLDAWPAHLFILTHLAGMTLTMPGNYGYRLILPLYLFTVIFAAAFAIRIVTAAASRKPFEGPQSAEYL